MKSTLESFKRSFKSLGQREFVTTIQREHKLTTLALASLLNVKEGHARCWRNEHRNMSESQIELLFFKLRELK